MSQTDDYWMAYEAYLPVVVLLVLDDGTANGSKGERGNLQTLTIAHGQLLVPPLDEAPDSKKRRALVVEADLATRVIQLFGERIGSHAHGALYPFERLKDEGPHQIAHYVARTTTHPWAFFWAVVCACVIGPNLAREGYQGESADLETTREAIKNAEVELLRTLVRVEPPKPDPKRWGWSLGVASSVALALSGLVLLALLFRR